MQITFTGRHPGVTDHVKDYALEKVGKLERFFDGTQRVEIIMSKEGDQSAVELVISVKGGKIVSESRQPELYTALDLVLDKAEKQLVRYKEKLKTHRDKHHTGAADIDRDRDRDMDTDLDEELPQE